eukprot:1913645-Rhodomonas_salina.1
MIQIRAVLYGDVGLMLAAGCKPQGSGTVEGADFLEKLDIPRDAVGVTRVSVPRIRVAWQVRAGAYHCVTLLSGTETHRYPAMPGTESAWKPIPFIRENPLGARYMMSVPGIV